ncbi:MAG TPA: chromosome partitioning ATPase, partial [Candidatus Competibacteraceae bacterium]|nr:chromosome partitioning ATPase [Candidatus Competibacteraceae bacterium]
MDIIERAMSGAQEPRPNPPAAPPPPPPSTLERYAAMATPPEPVVRATPKRTRRAIELDLEHIRALGLLVPDTRRSRIKEEYRHIKRPLLMNAAGKGASQVEHANLIMVTSARPGEGKTFTACNLALSIAAERDRTVLLVDADVAKREAAGLLGL